jgi:hypothetical protein
MSIGGRVTQIEACLSNSVVYQIFFRFLHKTIIEGMVKPIKGFLWAGKMGKRGDITWSNGSTSASLKVEGVLVLKT